MGRTDYAPASLPRATGALVATVVAGSPAERSGVHAGDRILTVDMEPLRDIIDWRWLTDGASAELQVRDAAGDVRAVTLDRRVDESWGIDFENVVFDGVRTCENRCAFCFMTQLPSGLRRALYVRDDDYRLSFLQGNFVSLTNLNDFDISRIAEQHLSPLYVSLHAVDPAVRERLVCARKDDALRRFDELVENGIELHVQIVLVPGVNDGDELDTTLTWLAQREGVASVGVVPLGFTRHQQVYSASYAEASTARAVIAQVEPWQRAFRARDATSWVYLADEFYLNAGVDVPPARDYDGFPQYENGIGIVRCFLDDFESRRPRFAAALGDLRDADTHAVLITGAAAGPVLRSSIESVGANDTLRVLEVRNDFFGGNVSVTGLIVGRDLADAVRRREADSSKRSTYLVPDVVFNADGLTLDDMTIDELRRATDADLRVISCDAAALLDGLVRLAAQASDELKE